MSLRYESFALARAPVRRARLGRPTELEGSLEGRLITLSGKLDAAVEVVAETHVSSEKLLAMHRCRGAVHLALDGGARILLDGPLAVAVGTHERKRYVPPHGMVSFRQLRAGCPIRARGRLRRVANQGPMRYRADAGIWALCATGTTNTIDLAGEEAPSVSVSTRWFDFMGEAWPTLPTDELDDEAPPSSAPEMLGELLRRRRGRESR